MSEQTLPDWLLPSWQRWCQLSQNLGHAYLLSGPSGIGIDLFVTQIVQATLCQQPQSSLGCGQCASCHLYLQQQHPDYHHLCRLEEKKEITVDQVRTLMNQLNETSHQGGYKVVWIEGVEFLNQSAFNALLKTLEEPAPRTLFLLTTHEVGRLPATIKSRCQLLSFSTPPLSEAMAWLQQAAPQCDAALMKRALRLNWGAPLNALAWINANKFEEDTQWKEGLQQLQSGRKAVSQVVAEWLKWQQPESVLDYFYQWTVAATRSIAYSSQGSETLADDALAQQQLQLQNWLRFQQAVLQAKQFWAGNANRELLLETLCLEWLEVQTVQAPFHSVFKSTLQKGSLS